MLHAVDSPQAMEEKNKHHLACGLGVSPVSLAHVKYSLSSTVETRNLSA